MAEVKAKYCSLNCCGLWKQDKAVERILANGSVENISQARMFFKRQYPHECMICFKSVWNSEPIPLLIDHIDGNSDNWLLSNLRKICPNCDAQLPTFKSRNKGKGRAFRRERYAAGKSY